MVLPAFGPGVAVDSFSLLGWVVFPCAWRRGCDGRRTLYERIRLLFVHSDRFYRSHWTAPPRKAGMARGCGFDRKCRSLILGGILVTRLVFMSHSYRRGKARLSSARRRSLPTTVLFAACRRTATRTVSLAVPPFCIKAPRPRELPKTWMCFTMRRNNCSTRMKGTPPPCERPGSMCSLREEISLNSAARSSLATDREQRSSGYRTACSGFSRLNGTSNWAGG